MNDAETARQNDQIDKLWGVIEKIREDSDEQWKVLREMRAVLVGLDGMDGMNTRLRTIETVLKGIESNQEVLRRYVDAQILNHPDNCSIGKMLTLHLQEGKDGIVSRRADWQKWVQTVAMVVAAVTLIITVVSR